MDQILAANFHTRVTPAVVAQDIRDLPLSIQVLPKLKRLLQDGASSMDTIVALLRLDPGLATRVLRMANSAVFTGCFRCQTLEDAVPRIGYQQIYETVACAVAAEVLIQPAPCYTLEADQLWHRSVTCALASERLANQCGADHNEAYTVGLLHNVGVVAMNSWMMRFRPEVTFDYHSFPREWTAGERNELEFTHAEVGATLLSHWDFPESIAMPVRWQYAPRATAAYLQMTTVLYAARWVRSQICDGELAPAKAPDDSLLSPIGISGIRLFEVVDEVKEALEQVNELLQIEQFEIKALPFPARA